jgi:molybdate transport system substrate-binding protein
MDLPYTLEYSRVMMPNRFRTAVAALCALLAAACNNAEPQQPQAGPVVLAAASLQESLEQAADAWADEGHAKPTLSFAGSSALARQIESGAPADVFISADEEWMDELGQKDLLRDDTRKTLLGNELVLIAEAGNLAPIALDDPASLPAALGDGRLAMADPDSVPAGKYGKAALEKLGIWSKVSHQIAPAENVRAALALVENKQSPLGIVYATDALISVKVRIATVFPADSHPPIRYPAAVLKASKHADAAPFLTFLESPKAREIFAKHGFKPPQ